MRSAGNRWMAAKACSGRSDAIRTGYDPFETIGLQTAPLDVRRDRESGIRSTTVEPGGSARVRSQADFAKCIECIFSVLLALASTSLKRGTAPQPRLSG
jgi:hypothetical protein